jgi:hypothetical protein
MKNMMKFGRGMLSLVLAFAILLGLCGSGFSVFANEDMDFESLKDSILKEFFGDGISSEEAFNKLLVETDQMNTYENLQYQYVPDKNSHLVALGDETAAVTKRQKSSYVDKLASALGIDYTNLAAAQMSIQDVYTTITENSKTIKNADLITIGWSNYGATYFMCRYLAGKADRVTEDQWIALVGEENMPQLEELLDTMFGKLKENNLSNFDGYDLEGGLECYAYTYMSNAIHLPQIIESIRIFNSSAAIVIVGTYNDLEGISLVANGENMDLGDMMTDLVNASNLLATKVASHYSRVAYVNAPDVSTTLDGNAGKYSTPQQYVLAIVGRQGLPNDNGHQYIADQIKSVFTDTCGHFWDAGKITTEVTCEQEGVMTYTCTWCAEQRTEAITGGHEYRTETHEATCTEDGYTAHICDKCGHTYKTDEVKATGHSWDEGVVTKEPTETQNGEKVYTCSVCGEKKTEVLPKTGDSVIGDLNGDGRINARDARALLRLVAGLTEPGEVDEGAADINNDGRINARDARTLLRQIAGLE